MFHSQDIDNWLFIPVIHWVIWIEFNPSFWCFRAITKGNRSNHWMRIAIIFKSRNTIVFISSCWLYTKTFKHLDSFHQFYQIKYKSIIFFLLSHVLFICQTIYFVCFTAAKLFEWVLFQRTLFFFVSSKLSFEHVFFVSFTLHWNMLITKSRLQISIEWSRRIEMKKLNEKIKLSTYGNEFGD